MALGFMLKPPLQKSLLKPIIWVPNILNDIWACKSFFSGLYRAVLVISCTIWTLIKSLENRDAGETSTIGPQKKIPLLKRTHSPTIHIVPTCSHLPLFQIWLLQTTTCFRIWKKNYSSEDVIVEKNDFFVGLGK